MRTLKLILAICFIITASARSVRTGECLVSSTTDSGVGSLRQCMLDAGNGDTITFSPMVFPPATPGTIAVLSALPNVTAGNITIDASGAGVVLNGNSAPGGTAGFVLVSESNTIRGLEIINFPGGGVVLGAGAEYNTLEYNLISGNGSQGVHVYGANNTIRTNLIGTDAAGTGPMGNTGNGIYVLGVAGNYIGPGNTIANNAHHGVEIVGSSATGNTVAQNSLTANMLEGISLSDGGNGELARPVITECTETSITGTAPPNCTIEVFSDSGDEGEFIEGITTSDGAGNFTYAEVEAFTGEYITATATDASGNTSEFSPAASVATEPTTWGSIKGLFK